ncbi:MULTISPECIES: AraC family transcriptional regulator [Peribacillus]|uniref:AraC family transcriptional regulator n=1 Tax=Peribacillus simplex TaxID=1478 RepID=A0A125QS41_9BACI|nr:AraC family transcriptional regulator [Peribacillus simplex]KWW20532.1 AraC family transcriptional regulator [Peribacillus simplex]
MKQSNLIPVINRGFNIHYFSKKHPSHDWLKIHDKSPEEFSKIESLFQLHQHDVLEVLVFLDGECDFFCEGKTYPLKRGDVVIIPPYAVHKANVKKMDRYERIIISVSEHLLNDFLSSSPTMKENIIYQKTLDTHVLHLHTKHFQTIIFLLDEITQNIDKGEENLPFTLNYQLFQVLQTIFDSSNSKASHGNKDELDQRFLSIVEYIESHFTDQDLSLDIVANHFHLNKYYFSHYFKKNMNLPFYRYVSLKRLSFAVTMIKKNQISIEKVALHCGFLDYSSFYRLFKKEYNISPKKLQKRFQNSY